MKKLLIVNNNLDTGGVQRSLVNLLNLIYTYYNVTLFVFSAQGDYRSLIPQEVEVIEAKPLLNLLGISQEQAKSKGRMLYIIRGVLAVYAKLINNYLPITLLVNSQPRLKGYDIAVSFLHNDTGKLLYGGCNDFVLKRVDANKKISFLHCDFARYGGNTLHNKKMYLRFDKVAAVSKGCKTSFLNEMPELEDQTFCVYNCHNYSEYIQKANLDPIEYDEKYLNILTVARIDEGKGIIRTIEVLKKLKEEGYRFKWHVIGDGDKSKEAKDYAESLGLERDVIFYGNQNNPYRYMKNADIFLLPSYHEAAPMVFGESKSLGLPVISTDTTSAKEMILEGKEGLVCENSTEGIYQSLKLIMDDPSMIDGWKFYLQNRAADNDLPLEQFHKLVN